MLLVNRKPCSTVLFLSTLLLLAVPMQAAALAQSSAAASAARTPTETVRAFYKALHDRRYREAFAISIYKPAIDGLTDEEFAALRPQFKNLSDKEFKALRPKYQKLNAEEFEDLRPEFERMASAVPENLEVSGEQISGETATVFVKLAGGDAATAQAEGVTLLRRGNQWIVGDKESEKVVLANGKEFFMKARIDAHHSDVQAMMERISLAEVYYSQQHNGQFADLQTLINAGLVPKDIAGSDTTGYNFHITLAADKKSYAAGAEPARYNHTGRLSFYLDDKSGIKKEDVGGKPLAPQPKKG
jgi:hypothetical protein